MGNNMADLARSPRNPTLTTPKRFRWQASTSCNSLMSVYKIEGSHAHLRRAIADASRMRCMDLHKH